MINAKIVADSLNEFGNRITTMVVTFPRFILAELNTHRMFSRNSASSRAIPFKKMIELVETNPFIPIAFQKDHSGMQGMEYLTGEDEQHAINAWKSAAKNATVWARALNHYNVTKQLCNRQLEPYMNHTVLITATEWENFFALRCPQYTTPVMGEGFYARSWKDLLKNHSNPENLDKMNAMTQLERLQHNKGQAEIHMMALAEAMWDAKNESVPVQLKAGEWHIPFGDTISHWDTSMNLEINPGYVDSLDTLKVKIATAMCARVSYTVVGEEGKEPNYENDIKLHDRLLLSKHLSPFEHCGRAMSKEEYYSKCENCDVVQGFDGRSGNFIGFIQYRKLIPGENGVQKE